MRNVELDICGRSYTVSCAAGEEAHVARLADEIGQRMALIQGIESQPDQRRFLFAALLLADELHKLRQDQSDGAPDSAPGTTGADDGGNDAAAAEAARQAAEDEVAGAIEAVAGRLEALAGRLEGVGDA